MAKTGCFQKKHTNAPITQQKTMSGWCFHRYSENKHSFGLVYKYFYFLLIKTASFIGCICESLQAAVDVSFGSEGVMKKMDTPIFTANINNNKNHLGGKMQNNTLCKPPRGGQRHVERFRSEIEFEKWTAEEKRE